LIPLIDDETGDNLLHRIHAIRRQVMTELGLIVPIVRIRITAPATQPVTHQNPRQEIAQGDLLAIIYWPSRLRFRAKMRVFNHRTRLWPSSHWIGEAEQGRAELMGYTVVTPISVLSTP
jgi:flagellar biosynthesis protein FlhA